LVGTLFDLSVWPDPRDRDVNTITIFPPFTILPPMTFSSNNTNVTLPLKTAYRTAIKAIGRLLLRDAQIELDTSTLEQRLNSLADDILEMEKKVGMVKQAAGKIDWYSGTATTIGQLRQNFTQLAYKDILSSIFSDADVSDSTRVIVISPEYFRLLDPMLSAEGANKTRLLNNYLVWSVVWNSARYMSWEYRYEIHRYENAAWGTTEIADTWHKCMDIVSNRFATAIVWLFYRSHTNNGTTNQIRGVLKHLQSSFLNTVSHQPYIDDTMRPIVRHKISSLHVDVGFPPQFQTEVHLNHQYRHLKINKSQGFLKNLINSNRFITFQASQDLENAYSNNIWRDEVVLHGTDTRPTYFWLFNRVLIPPASLSFPLFTSEANKAYNYGTLGSFISTAMMHSFDIEGSRILNGSFNPWWNDEMRIAYNSKRRCLHDYYGNLTIPPYVVDGQPRTARARGFAYTIKVIARLGGLQMAHKAAFGNGEDKGDVVLPGLNVSPQKLFFLAAVQTRCAVQSDADKYYRLNAGKLPKDILINGMLSHSTEFQQAFQCPASSTMNTQHKCKIFG